MESEYPTRPPAFLCRFLRSLVRSGEAARLGPNVVALLVAVGTEEDDQRWTGPVAIHLDGLERLLGLSRRTVLAARTMAVSSGWLGYRPGTRTRPPWYWLNLPTRFTTEFTTRFTTEGRICTPSGGVGGGLSSLNSAQEKKKNPSPSKKCPEPAKPPASGPAVLEVVMTFPTVGMGAAEWPLTEAKLAEYRGAFPGLDVLAQCRAALQWLRDNPTRRKTFAGMPKYLGGWLGRAQNQVGGKGAAPPGPGQPASERERLRQVAAKYGIPLEGS